MLISYFSNLCACVCVCELQSIRTHVAVFRIAQLSLFYLYIFAVSLVLGEHVTIRSGNFWLMVRFVTMFDVVSLYF